MIIDYMTTQTWGATGECNKCKYNRLHVTETITPSVVAVDDNGFGQFRFIKTYTWSCAACSAKGPLCNIDNT